MNKSIPQLTKLDLYQFDFTRTHHPDIDDSDRNYCLIKEHSTNNIVGRCLSSMVIDHVSDPQTFKKGTIIRYCKDSDLRKAWWDISAPQTDRWELPTEFFCPPPFPQLPPHIIDALTVNDWPKPWVRKEDRVYPKEVIQMSKHTFKQYRRTQIAEMCEWTPDFDMSRVSVSQTDKENGSPKVGDMIARNPKNYEDQWLVAKRYFEDNFESMEKTNE